MRLTRRSPTVGNEDHEDRVFTCSSRDHNQVREADVEGEMSGVRCRCSKTEKFHLPNPIFSFTIELLFAPRH
jgi:hypothetical protein